MGTWGHHNAEMGTCGRGDMLVRLGPGGPSGVATENTYGGMAQETAQGEKRLKKMIHWLLRHFLTSLYFDGRKNTTAKGRPTTSETGQYGATAVTSTAEGAAAASDKACRDSGSSSQWQSLPRQRHQRSRHQRRSQFGDIGDGEQLAAGGVRRTSDVCFYLVPLSKRFH